MKKIFIFLFLSSCTYIFAQPKQIEYSKQLQLVKINSYIFKTENTTKASEAKYLIELCRKKLNLNRAFFNSKNQLFIIESRNTITIDDIRKITKNNIIKFKQTQTSKYIRELFNIKKGEKPKKLPKFFVK